MPTRCALAFVTLFAVASAQGQSYCEPSFANGCFNWRNLAITIGGLDWTAGADACTTSDYIVVFASIDNHIVTGYRVKVVAAVATE